MTKNATTLSGKSNQNRPATYKLPAFSIDFEAYLPYLEKSDLTDDQKVEFIQTLWKIMLAFADLGFGIHPTQLAVQDECGQNPDIGKFITAEYGSVLNLEAKNQPEFNVAAADKSVDLSAERSPE